MSIPVYIIDTGVPVPSRPGVASLMNQLEVGESFQFLINNRTTAQSYASVLKRKFGKVFTIRKVDENTCRVWRQS